MDCMYLITKTRKTEEGKNPPFLRCLTGSISSNTDLSDLSIVSTCDIFVLPYA